MPLLFPLSPDVVRPYSFVGRSVVTVSRSDELTMRSTVEVTREMEESISRQSVDVENGDAVPLICDLVDSNLR